jgi:DHA3 family tetracycline resistance protein-like MFS transporter
MQEEPRGLARIGMLRPLKIRDFKMLWAGMTVSLFGDGLYLIAIAWQSYELSNLPSAFALVSLAWSLPMVLFLLVGGLASDRFDRRNVMIVSDVIRGLSVLGMGILALTGTLEYWHLIVLAALYGVGQAFFAPAFGAIIPDIVPQDQLVQANALDNFVRPLGERLAGPAIGGLVVALWSAGGAFVIDALTFVVSATFLSRISSRPPARSERSTSTLGEIREGFAFVRQTPWLWATLTSASLMILFVLGPFEVLVPWLIKNKLHGGADAVGFVFAASGAGGLVAAVIMGQRGLPRKHVLFMYICFGGGVWLLWPYAFITATWQGAIIEFLAWGMWGAGMVVWTTMMHRLVPRELLGRVTSLDWMVSTALLPISFALTGPVSNWIGVESTFIWAGALGGLSIFAFLLAPGVRDSERDGSIHPLPQAESA